MDNNSPSNFFAIFFMLAAAVLILPWLIMFIGISLSPSPPKPEIKYAEFPFKLVYEINGEQQIIKDTLICEYDGIGADTGSGKYLKWKGRLLSGNDAITLLEINNPLEKGKYGETLSSRNIVYWLGPTEYYMGAGGEHEYTFPDAARLDFFKEGGRRGERVSASDLFEKYGIKLIDWEIPPPIENTFK